jgi:hypothetical protein
VEVRVNYKGGTGQLLVRDLSLDQKAAEPEIPPPPPEKKGFWARLFGG